MKLSYRGVKYEDKSPILEGTDGEIGGTCRGQVGKFSYARHIPEPPSLHDLKYRGVPYRTRGVAVAVPTSALASRRTLPTFDRREREKVLEEVTRTHMANIRSSLERRMQAAQAQGNEQLVRILQQEQMAFPLG